MSKFTDITTLGQSGYAEATNHPTAVLERMLAEKGAEHDAAMERFLADDNAGVDEYRRIGSERYALAYALGIINSTFGR